METPIIMTIIFVEKNSFQCDAHIIEKFLEKFSYKALINGISEKVKTRNINQGIRSYMKKSIPKCRPNKCKQLMSI